MLSSSGCQQFHFIDISVPMNLSTRISRTQCNYSDQLVPIKVSLKSESLFEISNLQPQLFANNKFSLFKINSGSMEIAEIRKLPKLHIHVRDFIGG